ncbi:translocation/assembly module TamB domain-containing protein [Sphingomonas sp. URHD0057]|uniref:translocation/assembly module TamB domain-containing protein n=1 Tax=Sphingomonas sp. URHD0057 TaxID=1380389 RepID=UPI00048CAE65|nr:translocation/assembly module TamB [Sphingomonas sp. URHD0057]
MAEAVATAEGSGPPRRKLRRDWPRRLLNELFAAFIALLFLLAGALVLLDSAPGHRFIVDRLGRFETASGLNIRIGRIDGSIFGKSQLRNVRVSDTRGVFLTSPNIKLDWTPGAWLYNKLSIDSVTADRVMLIRLPKLKPSTTKGPILPGFDIHVGELRVDRLDIGKEVGGAPRSGSLRGKADVHSGRALVELSANLNGGGDHITFHLDAEPDRNRFDLAAHVTAPANGLVPAMIGVGHAMTLDIGGAGSWTRWRGTAGLDLSGRPTARLALGVDSGRYRLQGKWRPGPFLKGKLQRLTVPLVDIRGDATLKDRILDGRLIAATPELRAIARGALDLAENRFQALRLGVDLLKPSALFPNMTGKSVRMVWTLDGPFSTADYSCRLTSPHVQFDDTGFDQLRAEGRGRLSPWPMRVPIRLSARAITGIGDVGGAMLANPRIEGWLTVTPKLVRGDGLRLSSAKWTGKISLLIDLVTGRFDVTLSGEMQRYLIPGLGIVDVITDLKVVPGPNNRGSHVTGTAKAWVRRLDNSFFRDLTGGLPWLTTNLERGNDGVVHFSNLQIYSPKLRLSGAGKRNRDGTFHIVASGRQAKYGPLRLVLDGHIERPRIDLFLEHPNEAMGIRAMHLLLVPSAAGFDYRASGGSKLGPFTSNGRILLPQNGAATISIAALDAGGAHASGDLRSDPGGFTGRLILANGTLGGALDFAPASGAQRIDAHLTANGAHFQDAFSVRSGSIDGTIILADERTTIDGVIDARGTDAGGITLARLTANAKLVNGSGQVRAAFAGRRGAAFAFSTLADITPDAIRLTGSGRIERQPLVLNQAAVLTRSGDGWALAPTNLSFAGGTATVSGQSGSRPEVHAQLMGMPLEVLDLAWPGLDLSGSATGRLDYAWKSNRSGRIDLKVRGLSRAGLVFASKPIDVGIAAIVNGNQAGLRAVAASSGSVIGRAQARFAPLGGGPLVAELMNAPLFAQLRYTGPADTLWRLSGTEVIDLSGPLAVGADIGGRLAAPVIRGSLKTQNARLESAVTGMVIDQLVSQARFSGPQLIFSQISGRTSGGGSLTGTGSVTFAGGKTALNLSFNANQALLLNRDDIAARVTGPLKINSAGNGGTISGDLKLDKGRFQLGRASAAASVPQLNVREQGLDPEDVIEVADLHPWKLDIDLTGRDLQVVGLGINSRWTTNLKIGGLADAPRFTGRADLVRGDYDFAGRNFKLDRGVIRFRGESPPDPQLDIHAQAQVQGLDASVLVQGTGLKPEITFASSPPLPQDELLSRILFGTSITNLSAPEALQLASAVAALQSGSGSLDPINALRRAVGLDRLRIVPADVATGQKTSIAAGKYITRRLFVEVVTDGQGYSATRVEYQMTRWLSLLSTVSTIGRSSASVRVSKDY